MGVGCTDKKIFLHLFSILFIIIIIVIIIIIIITTIIVIIIIIIIIIITIIIQELQIRKQIYESLLLIKLYWQIVPRFIQFVFKWVDRLGMYNFFWELIPSFDHSEVENICLESSHGISGCFPYQLVVVFFIRTVYNCPRSLNVWKSLSYRLELSCKPTTVDSVFLAFLSSSCDENHPSILWLGVAYFPE